jgi:hypothetical protein
MQPFPIERGSIPRKFVVSILPKAAILLGVCIGAGAAQAQVNGTLAWAEGTSPFFADFNPGAGDTLAVVFNPDGGVFVNNATGIAVPPFTLTPPPYASVGVTPANGAFQFVSGTALTGQYQLTAPLVFDFANGATITVGTGSKFDYDVISGGSQVQFEFADGSDKISFAGFAPAPVGTKILAAGITFNAADAGGQGSYSANLTTGVPTKAPGPLPILGAAAAFGYSRKLRKRITSSITV